MDRSDQVVPRLAGRTFGVLEIVGVPVLDGTRPEIRFGFDGKVSGNATVNRLMGPYEVQGDLLSCGMLASTMMAGLPAAMEQEQRLLAVLAVPLRVSAGEGSAEILLDGAAGPLRLREVDPAADATG